jgi:SAM-dependent methyltransferase
MSDNEGTQDRSIGDDPGGDAARETPFWEDPEIVARFADREPDHRLQKLLPEYPCPAETRVLDLGCAGGRNSVYLAAHGFGLIAVDASLAMVEETRRRVAELLGWTRAAECVRPGRMDELDFLPDRHVELVVALGVYHSAASREEWDRTLAETFRVLVPGGRVLVSNHTDECDPDGKGLRRVPGEAPLYDRRSGRSFLVSAETLDREMERHGFVRLVPTATVRRETDAGGVRVTANGLYGRPGEDGPERQSG